MEHVRSNRQPTDAATPLRGMEQAAAWWDAFAAPSLVPTVVTAGEDHALLIANRAFNGMAASRGASAVGDPLVDSLPRNHGAVVTALLDRVRASGVAERMPALNDGPGDVTDYATYTAWPLEVMAGVDSPLIVQVRLATPEAGEGLEQAAISDELRLANRVLLTAGLVADEQAEVAEQRAAQFQQLLTGLTEGIIVLDTAGGIVLMNQAARAIWGLADGAGELDQRSVQLLRLDGTALDPSEWPTTRARQGESFVDVECTPVRGDEPMRVMFSANSISDENGGVSLAIVTLRDVTRLRHLEQLREDHAALISHDLRTPLTSIIGSVQLLLRRLPTDEGESAQASYLHRIDDAAHRMKTMIQDILDASYLESGRIDVAMASVDLAGLVEQVVASRNEPERIRVQAQAQAPRARADAALIERVLLNLLTNAEKYSPEAEPIVVDIHASDGEVAVSVSDRGDGIPADRVSRLFSRFYRAAQSGASGSYGLGLYVARLIVEAHGGRIWVDTAPGEGSTFTFTLAAAEDPR